MTTRLILRIPVGEGATTLSPEQQSAIANNNGRWAGPMPGTQDASGYYLADCLCNDAVSPALINALAPTWQVIGCWRWNGAGELAEIQPLDNATLLSHLPGKPIMDGFQIIGTTTPILHEPSRWAGWPAIPLNDY